VRIIYHFGSAGKFGVASVNKELIEFDIYVRTTEQYTVGDDRLVRRDRSISRCLMDLLVGKRYVENIRFQFEERYSLSTRMIGYDRYHVVFSYKTVH